MLEATEIRRHNLPVHLTSFVGRHHELRDIRHLLTETRLLTLTGTGGVGKTRLAIQIAKALQDSYSQGIWFLELAPLSQKDLLTETIASALNLNDPSPHPLSEKLFSYLESWQALLVFDNCEHLLDECARLAAAFLARCPGLSILTTSREPLGISGEVTYRVPSLDLPGTNAGLPLEQLSEYGAIKLFVERARASEPSFKLKEQNATLVAQICERLDGIPLALELAAARVRSLPVEQIASRLDDRFRLLTAGSRTALPRQQTLSALVEWSYNLLQSDEKVVLRRLAVFSGKWSPEAAEEICAGAYPLADKQGEIKKQDVLELLLQLVNKSLVQLDYEEGRYYLLETIRQFASEKLAEAGETGRYSTKHRDWYLSRLEEADLQLGGKEQKKWLTWMLHEQDNLRSALSWSLQQEEIIPAILIIFPLQVLWYNQGFGEALHWLDRVYRLSLEQPVPPELKARFLNICGVVNHSLGHFDQAEGYHAESLRLWKELGDKKGVARALFDTGWCNSFQLKLELAQRYADESLEIAREIEDRRSIAAAIHLKAISFLFAGKYEEVIPLGEQCLDIWRELEDEDSIVSTTSMLAQIQTKLGNYEKAKQMLAEGLALFPLAGERLAIGNLGSAIMEIAANSRKQPEGAINAARLMGRIENFYAVIGRGRPPMVDSEMTKIEKAIINVLGEEGYRREHKAGRNLSISGWWELASRVLEQDSPEESIAVPSTVYPNGLTAREVEVLRLVAAGLSNPEIAEKLVLSRRTVEAHLRSIFNKLEITSRSAATRFAVEHNLA